MTIPITLLLALAAIYAVKHKGADVPGMFLGVCIGVYGASGWIGQFIHSLFNTLGQLASKIGSSSIF